MKKEEWQHIYTAGGNVKCAATMGDQKATG